MVRRPAPKTTRTYRISEPEWRLIVAAAAAAETHPSSYLREAAVREARREVATSGLRSDHELSHN
jgi:uncharacterized protein (DUF1778 family)